MLAGRCTWRSFFSRKSLLASPSAQNFPLRGPRAGGSAPLHPLTRDPFLNVHPRRVPGRVEVRGLMLQTGLPNRAKPKIILFFLQNHFVLKMVWQTILRFSTGSSLKMVLFLRAKPFRVCKTISSLNWFCKKKQYNLRFCTVWQTISRIKLVTRELGWGGVKCPQWGELDVLVLSLVAL